LIHEYYLLSKTLYDNTLYDVSLDTWIIVATIHIEPFLFGCITPLFVKYFSSY